MALGAPFHDPPPNLRGLQGPRPPPPSKALTSLGPRMPRLLDQRLLQKSTAQEVERCAPGKERLGLWWACHMVERGRVLVRLLHVIISVDRAERLRDRWLRWWQSRDTAPMLNANADTHVPWAVDGSTKRVLVSCTTCNSRSRTNG